MNTVLTAALVAVSLFVAIGLGMGIRWLLPEHQLSGESKETVKLSMGLVATMAALLLGLLVSSAKGAYDNARSEVIQMAAKVALLERILTAYGLEAVPVRAQFRTITEGAVRQMWAQELNQQGRLALTPQAGNAVYFALQDLSPRDDTQRSLKAQATSLIMDLAQTRMLLLVQSVPSISTPLLVVVVGWLVVIFLGFSLVAPPNATAILALVLSALSVSCAILLILELDRPFGGLIQISNEPLLHALRDFGN